MSSVSNRTPAAQPAEVQRAWFVIDAKDLVLGRISTQIATVLRGKHKPSFSPHVDCGDYVIVVNADKVRFTGNKLENKRYYRYTGYFGGLKSRTAAQTLDENPEHVIRHSVKGMLPKNRLGRSVLKKLKIYPGAEHPHAAQLPQPFPTNV